MQSPWGRNKASSVSGAAKQPVRLELSKQVGGHRKSHQKNQPGVPVKLGLAGQDDNIGFQSERQNAWKRF